METVPLHSTPLDFVPEGSGLQHEMALAAQAEVNAQAEERDQTVGNLGERAGKGVSWTLLGTLFIQVLGLTRTAALARLLSQSDFGVAAMAITVLTALYTLTNTGVVGSVIAEPFQTKKQLHDYTNTVWTMEIARGGVVSLLLALMSLPVAHFYREPRLTPILIAFALTPIFTSLGNIGLALQTRRMEFNRTALNGMTTGAIQVALTIALAWWTRNYWALVWGQVIGSGLGCGFSYFFSSYRPRLNFNREYVRRAFNFGKHIFVIGMANYVLTVVDNVIVGRVLGATALGIYVIAYAFCNLPSGLINGIFNSILFPMFANVGRDEDSNRTNIILERAVALACTALLTILTPLVALSPAIVRLIYGTKWTLAIGPMRILLLSGLFASLLILLSTFLVGTNRPQVESRAKIFDAIVFLIVIYPLALWLGIIGAALGSCVTALISLLYRWYRINQIAPAACRRLPWLMGSTLLCFGGISGAIILAGEIIGNNFQISAAQLFRSLLFQSLPSLGAAWLQLILGLPLVALLSLGSFVLVQPMARGEVVIALGKARAFWAARGGRGARGAGRA